MSEIEEKLEPLDRATILQNGLIAEATGGVFDGGADYYKSLRAEFLQRSDTKKLIPDFVKRCRDTSQFWQFIKFKFKTYAERRNFIYEAFVPLLDYLETSNKAPHQANAGDLFLEFTPDGVPEIWQKSLQRISNDPAGAITLARTLIESVCKYILDEEGVSYKKDADLPKLWALCAEELNLSPSQHNEKTFKAILGNCQSIVNYLGTLRNRLSDSHGQGKLPVRPKTRHAELAVNLAGTMASFLIATWQAKKGD